MGNSLLGTVWFNLIFGIDMQIPPHFLVIIPGFMGSKLNRKKGGDTVWADLNSLPINPLQWEGWLDRLFREITYPNDDLEAKTIVDEMMFLIPWAKQERYGQLIAILESLGYKANSHIYNEKERDIYCFAYDWRQDNRKSAYQLGDAISRWSDFHPGCKVWIIAHSNGGNVARWYIEKLGGSAWVDRLFLFGAPWNGSPKTMAILMNGMNMVFRRKLSIYDIPMKTKKVLRTFPSAYQLIPWAKPFIVDVLNDPVNPYQDTGWLDENDPNQKNMLLDAWQFNQDLGNHLSIDTVNFFGRKQKTTNLGILYKGPKNQWKDIQWVMEEPGDGTIPVHSAVYQDATVNYPFSVGHGDIYVNPRVMDILEWELCGKYLQTRKHIPAQNTPEVMFDFDKNIYKPGEIIRLRLSINKNEVQKALKTKAAVVGQMVWKSPLPAAKQPKGLLGSKAIQILEDQRNPQYYELKFNAPGFEGYYNFRISVTMENHPPILLSETIAIEGE